ncbi:hypothetical protein GGI20_001263 [Coemansia sp. BCRC 34301]|nr:hypothetical protein GGI20_001263 [Coemansia sp. BCRC 34301]
MSKDSSGADYFKLVSSNGDGSPLDSRAIERGLLAAIADTSAHAGSTRQEHMATLLGRFVYSDQDRHTVKGTSLALALLKILGRQIDDSCELGTERAITGLLSIALEMKDLAEENDIYEQPNYAVDACNEALTCVANTMLLLPRTRRLFADDCHGADAVDGLLRSKVADLATTAFLCGRCLLVSLETPAAAAYCVSSLGLQVTLARVIRSYLERCESPALGGRFSPHQVMSELFKAAMSLCVYYERSVSRVASDKAAGDDDSLPPEHAAKFVDILKVSLDTLCKLPLSSGHLDDPAKQAVGIALNFPTLTPDSVLRCWLPADDVADITAEQGVYQYIDRIYQLFATLVDTAADGSLVKTEITPLALVLVRLVTEHTDVRERIFYNVFPKDTCYEELPEDRPGIWGKLVRLMRVPEGGMLAGAIGDFLLAVLGQDVAKFVLAVGYGNAAGYMLARGIEIPESVIRQVRESEQMVDPVTGSYLNREDVDRELANMTDEEKEREAERLFVLFERLNKTGFIKVDNPVRAAMDSGRFQEIEESKSDDS